MDFSRYQQAALKTDQPPAPGTDPVTVPLLGLLGEAGSVATVYKKQMRDGAAFRHAKHQLREELGDVLWYVAALADRFGLDLDDIAVASLVQGRRPVEAHPRRTSPVRRQLPRRRAAPARALVFTFTPGPGKDGRTVITLRCDGQHDRRPSHRCLTYRRRLPAPRRLPHRLRRGARLVTGPQVPHETQAQEQPASRRGRRRRPRDRHRRRHLRARILLRRRHDYLEDIRHIDNELLTTIGNMVSHLEVSTRRAADWEKAIITGFAAWRQLPQTADTAPSNSTCMPAHSP